MNHSTIVCGKCGAANRIPPERSPKSAKCGNCGHKIFAGSPEEVEGVNFDIQIKRNSIPVLVDVWAPWCGPCLTMAPAFEEAARKLEPQVRAIKLNSEAEQDAAVRLGIRSIPTMILFHQGREVARTSGAMSASQIVHWVCGHLPSVAV